MLLTESVLYDLLIIFASLFTCLYFFAKERYQYFAKRNVAYSKPLFIIGNTLDGFLFKKSFGELLQDEYNKYPTQKISGFFQGLNPIYMVRDPDLVNRILVKEFSYFYSHGFVVDEEVNPMDGNLFASEGNRWRTLRKKLTPTFTSGKLKWMYNLMELSVDAFLEHLDGEVDKEIEIRDALCRLATDIIGSCAFGISPVSIKDPDSEFRRIGKKVFNPSTMNGLRNLLRFIWPSLALKLKVKTIDTDVNDFMISITEQTFEHRLKTGTKRNDFIQLLLQLREKGEVEMDPSELEKDEAINDPNIDSHVLDDSTANKLVITDNVLAAQLFVFFIAGFETSATGMSYVCYLLSKNPVEQKKAREEVKRIKEKHGGFTYDALKEMTYLDAIIKETLRMYPPFASLIRKCTRTCALDDGITIDKGVGVMISIIGIQMDPKNFDQPEKFQPERFMGDQPKPGTYAPFGEGPRSCIAIRFAQMEMKLTIAKMLDRYNIDTCQKMRKFEPIRSNPKSFVNEPKDGIWCILSMIK